MAKRHDKSEPPRATGVGFMFLGIAAVFAVFAEHRNWLLIAALAVSGLTCCLIGSGWIYRPAVSRAGDTITCRFTLWRDAMFYGVLVAMPALAVTPLLEGAGSPGYLRVIGILYLLWTGVLVFRFVRQALQSRLVISPAALSVSLVGQPGAPADIPRAAVQEVTATTAAMLSYDSAPATQISYRDAGAAPGGTRMVLFGPTNTKKTSWLTVEQADLLAGLQAWKDGDPHDPALMDRVEAILLGNASRAA